jgi:hypothetical protein
MGVDGRDLGIPAPTWKEVFLGFVEVHLYRSVVLTTSRTLFLIEADTVRSKARTLPWIYPLRAMQDGCLLTLPFSPLSCALPEVDSRDLRMVLCCAVVSNKLYMVLSQHERILVWRPDLQKLSSFRNGAVRTWKCGAFSFRTVLRHHKLSSPRIEALEIWNGGGLQRLQKRVAISESHPTSDA